MTKNFYSELKLNIEEHLKNNENHKALLLIEEELKMPYIPIDIEEFLKEKHKEILFKIYDAEKKLDAEKIIELLKSNITSIDKYDLSNNLTEYNLDNYKKELEELLILEQDILDVETKRNLLQLLVDQGNKEIWKIKEEDNIREIDLSKIKPFKDDIRFIELSSKIEKILFQNPVALNMALNILEMTFMKIMFEHEEVDLKDADIFTVLLTLKLLGEEEEFKKLEKQASKEILNKLAKY